MVNNNLGHNNLGHNNLGHNNLGPDNLEPDNTGLNKITHKSELGLAWNQEQGERKRLWTVAAILCPVFFLAAVYITWVTLPELQREEAERLPPQLAKIILQKTEPPPPVVKLAEKKPEPEKEKEPEKDKPKPEIAKKPEPKVKPPENPRAVATAREKVKKTGILALSQQLSKLNDLAQSVQLDAPKPVTLQTLSQKAPDALAAQATAVRSAGIDESRLPQAVQPVALSDRKQLQVAQADAIVADVAAEKRARQQEAENRRRSEDLRRTMDANKSAIFSIYNRELRKKPSLQGRITPELVIEENGSVSSCAVVESTLSEPSLESKICNRLRLVDFGYKPGVDRTTIRYPIELLPG